MLLDFHHLTRHVVPIFTVGATAVISVHFDAPVMAVEPTVLARLHTLHARVFVCPSPPPIPMYVIGVSLEFESLCGPDGL